MNKDISRRKFVKIGGSLAIGGAFAAYAGGGLWNMFKHPENLFYGSKVQSSDELVKEGEALVSPYRRIFGFIVPDQIAAFEVSNGSIYIGTKNEISVYGMSGELQDKYAVPADMRDLTVYDGNVYALYATRIEVYGAHGDKVRTIDACSETSDYNSLTVFDGGIFVTDASNKNICKYTLDGTLARFITSPSGFVVPSYCFGITNMNGKVYCSNPGRHKIEQYTAEGEFISSFGETGTAPGRFSGCCNPVIITPANNGEILTSEKGVPRISCYEGSGHFRSVLLDAKALGGGHAAYDVRVVKDKLIVAGGNKVSIFQYNKTLSQDTACGQCDKDCPLKTYNL